MKVIKEMKNGSLVASEGDEFVFIPNDEDNKDYQAAIKDDADGVNPILPFDVAEESARLERDWRNTELNLADTELSKVQDGRGKGLTSDWRDYRNSLRDWPAHPQFPDVIHRPSFKDNKGGPK